MNTFGFLFHQFPLNLRYMKIQRAFLKLTGQNRNYFILAGTLLFGESNVIYSWPRNNVEIQGDNSCAVENLHTTFDSSEKLCCPLVSQLGIENETSTYLKKKNQLISWPRLIKSMLVKGQLCVRVFGHFRLSNHFN